MDVTEVLREVFSDLDQNGAPGATCAIVREGEMVDSITVGEASVEHGVPNTSETVFYIASISKQFVGCAVAMLESEGSLTLDQDIRDFLPEMNRFEEVIRVHDLVHHTSGIRDKYALAIIGGLPDESYSTDEGTLRMLTAQRNLNFSPGARYLYSNSGYWLLAQIVECVAGEPLEEFTHKRIFGPAGMEKTQFRKDPGAIIKNKASGYLRKPDGSWRVAEYTYSALGPGGVFTTVDDLARWDRVFSGGVLEPEDLPARLLRTRPLTNGKSNNYAFGLVIGKHRGVTSISHGGGVEGYSAEILRYPDHRLTVICLANTSHAQSPLRALRVGELLLGKEMEQAGDPGAAQPETPEAPEFDLERYAGIFISEDRSSSVEVKEEEGKITAHAGSQTLPLQPVAGDRVTIQGVVEVTFDDDGFTLRGPGTDEGRRFVRLKQAVLPDIGEVAGVYHSDELSCDLDVITGATGWEIRRNDEKTQPLRYLGETFFSWTVQGHSISPEVLVTVLTNTNGQAEALSLSNDRALNVVFKRKD